MSSKNKKDNSQTPIDQINVNIPHIESDFILREHLLRLRLSRRLISLRHPDHSCNMQVDIQFLKQDKGLVGHCPEAKNDSIKTWDDDDRPGYLGALKLSLIVFFFAIGFQSCTKLIEVDAPITSTNADLVYATDAGAISVLTSIYTNMSENTIVSGGITSMPLFTGLYSDEFTVFSASTNTAYIGYATNSLTGSITEGTDFWNNIYPIIFTANSALEGLARSGTLTSSVKQQLMGEAKFIRAFCYLYLVNLYGDVPLVLTTDYKANSLLARTSSTDVYKSIFLDLKEAEKMLSDQYIDGTVITPSSERTSPTKWAARALLARAYLYSKDYVDAELYSSLSIENKVLFDTVDINSVFLKNSKEAIWQLQPVGDFVTNTWDGKVFGLTESGPNTTLNPVYLSADFVSNFEAGDLRKFNWINTVKVGNDTFSYPYKYKVNTTTDVSEYSMVLRLSEQYLIRAEARINQGGKIAEGLADLNVLRARARAVATIDVPNPLPPLSSNLSKESALAAVEHERQVELFTEWGHRWFDLRRLTGRVDASKTRADEVLSVKKGSNWQSTDLLFPIPQSEIDKNPSLQGHQNPGYN